MGGGRPRNASESPDPASTCHRPCGKPLDDMADQRSADLASLRIQRDDGPPPRTGWWRWLAGCGAVVLLACAGIPLWTMFGARVVGTTVEVTEVRLLSPAHASTLVTSSGFVAARVESKVGARVLGRVAEVLVREGDLVEAGQVLVRLDEAEARTALAASRARAAAARARLQSANATLSETRRQHEREKGLAERGAGLPSVVEDLSSRVTALEEAANAARADAAAAAAELEQLDLALQFMTLTAPIGGIVTTDPVDVGELVGPQTPPVVELADFSTLVVETDVPEARLGLVKRDGPAEIVLDAYPTVRHRGRVAEFSPRVNRAKATVVVRVEFVDPVEGVLPDMAARVSFLQGELDAQAVKEPPKLFVPGSAVAERGGEKVVFRLDDGRVRRVRVKLGPPMAGGFELVEGPGDGTRVVANPPSSLDDGYPVREESE